MLTYPDRFDSPGQCVHDLPCGFHSPTDSVQAGGTIVRAHGFGHDINVQREGQMSDTQLTAPKAPATPLGINHLVLNVRDIEELHQF